MGDSKDATCGLCGGARRLNDKGKVYPCPACEMLIQESRVSLVAAHQEGDDTQTDGCDIILGLKKRIVSELATQITEKGFVQFKVSEGSEPGRRVVKATAAFVRPGDFEYIQIKRASLENLPLRRIRKWMINAIERSDNPSLNKIVHTMSKRDARRIVDRFLLRRNQKG